MSRHIVQVSAGQGPVEVRRFVAKLAERLTEVCEASGLVVREAVVRGDEAEPSSVELHVEGDVLARLAGERGTHALVCRSESRGRGSRKRWFAGVAIHEATGSGELSDEATLDPRDLEITAARAPGPGGQHVNTTATAVRVRHRPTGITVRVTDERSQRANIKRAVLRIAERLAAGAAESRAEGEAARRMAHYRSLHSAPVRTYRLGPRGQLTVDSDGGGAL